MNAFCASVNFDAFTVLHSSQPGKSEQKTLTQNDPILREQSITATFARASRDIRHMTGQGFCGKDLSLAVGSFYSSHNYPSAESKKLSNVK
jgi:hypothetical protein